MKIIDCDGAHEEETVESIAYSSMAREKYTRVLDSSKALDKGFAYVPNDVKEGDDGPQCHKVDHGCLWQVQPGMPVGVHPLCHHTQQQAEESGSCNTLPCLGGAEARECLVPAHVLANIISCSVSNPRGAQHQRN